MLQALATLPNSVQNAFLRGMLRKALKPLAVAVKSKTPVKFGDLKSREIIGTKLTKRQASFNRGEDRVGNIEVHFGTADPAGQMDEFGNSRQQARPFFRPEWEARKGGILAQIEAELGAHIILSMQRRVDRRLAKQK